jgi:crossover junction endodeoxyribonuclease RuvC
MRPTVVLGIDPGFASIGFAAVGLASASERVLRAWVVRTEPSARKRQVRASEDNARRAMEIAAAVEAALGEFAPVALAAETMSWPRNAAAAAKVALAWGVLCAAAHRHRLPLVQASPQEVKRAVCGRKSASKGEVIEALELRYPDIELPDQLTLQEHAADATAVVVACLEADVIRMARRMAA